MTTSSTEQLAPTREYAAYGQPWWRRLLLTREFAVIALLILVVAYSLLTVRNFDSQLTLTFLLLDVAPILLIALPMTLIIATGEIDLSVASVVGLTSVTTGILVQAGLPMAVAAACALVVGALCGAFNGFLVAYVGLPSLAVTIGTLALFRGLAVGLLGTTAVTDFPDSWKSAATGTIGTTGIPQIMILFVVLLALFVWLLHFSSFGRGVYDIGLAKEAARFTGVDVARTKFILFLLAGLLSALAGVYYTLRYGSARGDNATGLELQVIAAVLLGGVSIFGGRGKLHGVVAGVLLIGVIGSALRLEGITVNIINIVIGLLLVASVVSSSVVTAASTLLGRRRRPGPSPTSPAPTGAPSER